MKIASKDEHIPNNFIAASRKHLTSAVPAHIHEFFEIEFVISGDGICCVDGYDYAFSNGSIFFLSPINTHEIKKANAEIFNVMFRCDDNNERLLYAEPHLSRCPLIQVSGENRSFLYQLLSELVSVYDHDIDYARLLLSCLLKKLDAITAKNEYKPSGYIQQALLYTTENFKSGISLSSVAKHIGLTPTYFSNLFRQETGIKYSTYLDNLRFSYAKNLLSLTNQPILEIARLSGFEDYTNFERRFKKTFHQTPSEFRKSFLRNAIIS